ncbi:MAG: hypothetical protein MJ101_05685, partial [Clostridia bacterium]|nr:hypothetical protein [Clostridia bacterium]
MKKVLAVLLAVLMLAGTLALVACGDNNSDTTTQSTVATTAATQATQATTAGGSEATTAATTPATQSTTAGGSEATTAATQATTQGGTTPPSGGDNDGYSRLAGFEDVDFGGREFLFVSTFDDSDGVGRWNTAAEIFQESLNNTTPLTAAVYNRNTVMKNLYNCSITLVQEGNGGTLVSNDILSNTNTVDFYTSQNAIFTGGSANLMNAYSLDIDFTAEGWNQNFFRDATIVDNNGNKKLFNLDGDFNPAGVRGTWAVYCNLNLLEQNFPDVDIFKV